MNMGIMVFDVYKHVMIFRDDRHFLCVRALLVVPSHCIRGIWYVRAKTKLYTLRIFVNHLQRSPFLTCLNIRMCNSLAW